MNCWDLFDRVWFVMKIRQYNDVTDHTSVVYAENDTELLWSIGQGAVCDKNHRGQWRDRYYKCCLRWKRYWTIMTDWIGCRLWPKPDKKTMCLCRHSILFLDTCMYLEGIARTQFLYVTAMETLLGLIGFRTSREFNYVQFSASVWFIMICRHGQFLGSYHAIR